MNLNGIPAYSIYNITSVSDTGKSLMVEQFAVEQTRRGNAVCFIRVESPANYENKEMMARAVVRILFNFMKKWYQTALFVSQKRSGHEKFTAEAAGGYAVGRIVDGTMVFAKEMIDSGIKAKLYKKEIGDIVRLFRIDGCRMCGHDTKTHLMEITDLGLIRMLEPISSI